MNRPRSRRLLLALLVTQAGPVGAQAARITVAPSQPVTGAIVRLTIDRLPPGDSVVSVRGSMAGEALHFRPIVGASLHAIAGTNFSTVAKIFDKHCLDCHASEDPEGKLVLESFDALMKGGESGKVIVPGKSAESLLIKMVEGTV